jgi:hypothetical protein
VDVQHPLPKKECLAEFYDGTGDEVKESLEAQTH